MTVTGGQACVSIHSIPNRPIHFRAHSAGEKRICGADNSPTSVVKGIVSVGPPEEMSIQSNGEGTFWLKRQSWAQIENILTTHHIDEAQICVT
jgi:hypothetical protein